MKAFFRDNALGLAFGAAFLLALAGQSVAGLVDFNNQQIAAGTDPVGYLDYLTSSSFAVDVAELSITVGGASKLVDRIEAAGHCRRRPHPADKRSSLIELTTTGGQLLTTATAAFQDGLHHRLGAAIPAASLQQFTATLAALRSASHRVDATEGQPR
jgi:hypothetical protein